LSMISHRCEKQDDGSVTMGFHWTATVERQECNKHGKQTGENYTTLLTRVAGLPKCTMTRVDFLQRSKKVFSSGTSS
jgi:hypothetical protein